MKRSFYALLPFLLLACKEEPKIESLPQGPVPGEVQVLNACGIPGAANRVREYLMAHGFDVVEVGNGEDHNYTETIIALRHPWWPGGKALGQVLHSGNIIPLENPLRMVDATVFIGRDFEERIHE